MARQSSVSVSADFTISNANTPAPPSATRPGGISASPNQSWTAGNAGAGTGPNQWQKCAYWQGSLAASTPVTIDLTTIKLVDGGVGFAHVREIIINNGATNGTFKLLLGDSGANGFKAPFDGVVTGKVAVMPGLPTVLSNWLATSGWTVDATNKDLKLDPGANAVPVILWIKGD